MFAKPPPAEHTKNARNSTRNRHEEGQARRMRDAFGEKGDLRRTQPRNFKIPKGAKNMIPFLPWIYDEIWGFDWTRNNSP